MSAPSTPPTKIPKSHSVSSTKNPKSHRRLSSILSSLRSSRQVRRRPKAPNPFVVASRLVSSLSSRLGVSRSTLSPSLRSRLGLSVAPKSPLSNLSSGLALSLSLGLSCSTVTRCLGLSVSRLSGHRPQIPNPEQVVIALLCSPGSAAFALVVIALIAPVVLFFFDSAPLAPLGSHIVLSFSPLFDLSRSLIVLSFSPRLAVFHWYGFISGYHCWYEHGENGDEGPQNFYQMGNHIDDVDVGGDDPTTYREMLHNVAGPSFNWNHVEESPNPQARQLYDMIEASSKQLWSGCKTMTTLSAMARLLAIKSEHHISERGCYICLSEVCPVKKFLSKRQDVTFACLKGLVIQIALLGFTSCAPCKVQPYDCGVGVGVGVGFLSFKAFHISWLPKLCFVQGFAISSNLKALKPDDHGISSWGWNLSGQHSTYHALFPRAWTIYDGTIFLIAVLQ
ncbi:hypothetical protein Syun_004394 [Stephania yunnanensis]|uniref:Glycosyl-hydrolase family 116 N-terminal domain-containing protein n=1 Tax=Stephania yunnanensis TaxID=152371 RepID=A0AAP0Q0R6_9MAGN